MKFCLLGLIFTLSCCSRDNVAAPSASTETHNSIAKKPSVKEVTQKELRAQVEALTVAAESKALAEAPKLLAQMQDEHAKDVAAYKFKVSRWGDWLEISLARLGNKAKLQKFSTSINLKLVTTVHLAEGHGPDEDGELRYDATTRSDARPDTSSGMTWSSNCDPWELPQPGQGRHWEIIPDTPTAPSREMFYEISQRDEGGTIYSMGYGNRCGYYGVQKTTTHYPRFAADDVIHFDGIAILYAPAGLGEKVYREILAAKDSTN